MAEIITRFDFSSSTPAAGSGQDHSEGSLSSLSANVFNEYERVMSEICTAIGDYSINDTVPSTDEALGDSLIWMYNDLVDKRWAKSETTISKIVEYDTVSFIMNYMRVGTDSTIHSVKIENASSGSNPTTITWSITDKYAIGNNNTVTIKSGSSSIVKSHKSEEQGIVRSLHLFQVPDSIDDTLSSIQIGSPDDNGPLTMSMDIGLLNISGTVSGEVVHLGANTYGRYNTADWSTFDSDYNGIVIGAVTRQYQETELDDEESRHVFGFVDKDTDTFSYNNYITKEGKTVASTVVPPSIEEEIALGSSVYISGEFTVSRVKGFKYAEPTTLYDQTILANSGVVGDGIIEHQTIIIDRSDGDMYPGLEGRLQGNGLMFGNTYTGSDNRQELIYQRKGGQFKLASVLSADYKTYGLERHEDLLYAIQDTGGGAPGLVVYRELPTVFPEWFPFDGNAANMESGWYILTARNVKGRLITIEYDNNLAVTKNYLRIYNKSNSTTYTGYGSGASFTRIQSIEIPRTWAGYVSPIDIYGDRIAVGCALSKMDAPPYSGQVAILNRDITSDTYYIEKIIDPPENYTSAFGVNVSIGRDILFALANVNDILVYRFNNNKWELDTIIDSTTTIPSVIPAFSHYDGDKTLAVSSYAETVDGAEMAGCVFVYIMDDAGVWTHEYTLNGSNIAAGNQFARVMFGQGSTLVVQEHPSVGLAPMKTYVYELPYPAENDVVIYNSSRSGWEKYRPGMTGTVGVYLGGGAVALPGSSLEPRNPSDNYFVTDTSQLSSMPELCSLSNNEIVARSIPGGEAKVRHLTKCRIGFPNNGWNTISDSGLSEAGLCRVSSSGDNLYVAGLPGIGGTSRGISSTYHYRLYDVFASGIVDFNEISPTETSGELAGWSMSSNGDLLCIGNPSTASGEVRVYFDEWEGYKSPNYGPVQTLEDTLNPASGNSSMKFGNSVAIYGSTIAVGSPYIGATGVDRSSGEVHIYQREGEYAPFSRYWDNTQTIYGSSSDIDSYFGYSTSMDRDLLVVTAPNSTVDASRTGAAFIFRKDYASREWTEEQVLDSDYPVVSSLADSDRICLGYGSSCSVRNNSIAIGAPNEDDFGAVYLYKYSGSSFELDQMITFSGVVSSGSIGTSVSLSSNTLAAIGYDADVAVIYRNTEGSWEFEESVEFTNTAFRDVCVDGSMVYLLEESGIVHIRNIEE